MRCRSGRGEVGVIFKKSFSSGRVGEERKRGQAAEASKREGGRGRGRGGRTLHATAGRAAASAAARETAAARLPPSSLSLRL